jgi:hypothetical protein
VLEIDLLFDIAHATLHHRRDAEGVAPSLTAGQRRRLADKSDA